MALSRLIQFSSYNDQPDVVPSAAPSSRIQEDRPTEFRYSLAVRSDGNHQVYDDDEWIADTRLEQESFPALPTTANTTATAPTSVRSTNDNPYSWRNRVSETRSAPQRGDFPSFSSSGFGRGNRNNDSTSLWRTKVMATGNGSISSNSHNQRSAASQRRRLILKPRSNVTKSTVSSNSTRNDKIFGAGKARDNKTSDVLSDVEKRNKELERYEQALCPYSPDLLIFAKSNIQMVTSVERKLNEFLNKSTNAVKYFDFPPMKLLFRSVLHSICVCLSGVSTTESFSQNLNIKKKRNLKTKHITLE